MDRRLKEGCRELIGELIISAYPGSQAGAGTSQRVARIVFDNRTEPTRMASAGVADRMALEKKLVL